MIVLASASPRRRELLASAGRTFEVRPFDIDERLLPGEPPDVYALRLARAKAVAARRPEDAPGTCYVGSDTVVAQGPIVHGKPSSADEARSTLRALSGAEHHVLTAVAVLRGGRSHARVVRARVRFRPLTDGEIDAYVGSGEPFDKAGAYGIQGYGGALVDRVVGSYTAIVGLPLRETLELLDRALRMPT
jgi:septum formation protein